ncbi:MAG: sigma-70 family RNA polymerase sigma factor [Planctomycetota bacterium]
MSSDLEQLRKALREGDNSAFRQVVRELTEPLYRYVRPQVGASAEDVVQQTFIRLWKHRKRLKTQGSLRTYLYFIATNLVRDTQRREALRRKRENEAAEMQTTEAPGMKALAREAFEAAKQLSPELHEVVLLRYGQGFTAVETADALGIPEGTVKTRQRSAIEKLREKLLSVGALPAGLDLEQSMREGAKTSVKVPSSLVTNMEALVMANAGTNAGVTAGILAVVFALLLLVGGVVAVGTSWLVTSERPNAVQPIGSAAGDGESSGEVDGSSSDPLEGDANSTLEKPGNEKPGNADNGKDPANSAGSTTEADEVVEFSVRGRVVDEDDNGIGGAWVGLAAEYKGDASARRYSALGKGSLSELDSEMMSHAVSSGGGTSAPDFQFESTPEGVTADSQGYYEFKGRGVAPEHTAGFRLIAWAPGFRGSRNYVGLRKDALEKSDETFKLYRRDRFLTFKLDPPVSADFMVELRVPMGSAVSINTTDCEEGPGGLYQLTLERDQTSTMRFRVPGYAVSELEVPDHGEHHVDAGVIKLSKGRELSGVVVDDAGAPVSGALVKLKDDFDVVAECAADGSFTIEGASAEAQTLYARDADHAEALLEVAAGQSAVQNLRITMVSGVTVEGMVRFRGTQVPEDMQSVKVVLVRAGATESYAQRSMYRLNGVNTDETHAFRFNRVAPGDYVVRASYDGKTSSPVRIRVDDLPVQADVVFGAGLTVSGHITGKDGNPAANTKVSMTTFADSTVPRSYHAETDIEGNYKVEDVDPGTYIIIVDEFDSAFDESLFSRRRVVVEDEPVTLNIDYSVRVPGNRVFGCVTLDGQPVFDEYMLEGTGLNNGLWHVLADDAGAFEVQGVPPGSYYFYATSRSSSATIHRDIVEFSGWNAEHDVSRSLNGGTLTVRLHGEGLDPAEAKLTVRPQDNGRLGPDVLLGMVGSRIPANEDGEFIVTPVVTGKYIVIASCPGFGGQSAVVEVSSKTTIDLKLSSMQGSLNVELQKLTGIELDEQAFPFCLLRLVALDMPGQPVLTTRPAPLKVGSKLLGQQLSPGLYRLEVTGPMVDPYSEEFEIKLDAETNVALELQAAARLELTVDLPAEIISGALVTITDATGEPVIVTGLVNPIIIGMPQPKPAKRIDVGPLKPGNYRVVVKMQGYLPITLDVTLARGQVQTRTLEPQAE